MNQKTTLLVLTLALAITGALAVAPILSEMVYASAAAGGGGGGGGGGAGHGGGGGGAAGGKGLYTTNGHHHCFDGAPGC